MVKLYSIEGNIGSGKTTFIKFLTEYSSNKKNLIILPEPLALWENIVNSDGDNVLTSLYKNQERNALNFQIIALFTRRKLLVETMENALNLEKQLGEEVIILSERTLKSDYHIFATMLHNQKKLSDHDFTAYKFLYNEYSEEFKLSKAIYIKTSPEICHQRVDVRSRNGEDHISLSYLKDCDKAHEDFYNVYLSTIDCKIINNDHNFHDDTYEQQIKEIIEYLF